MVVGQLLSKPLGSNRRYLRSRQRYPLRATEVGPTSPLADRLFQKLKDAKELLDRENRPRSAWISQGTWTLADQRSAL